MSAFRILPSYIFKLYIRYFLLICLLFTLILVSGGIFDLSQKFKSLHIPLSLFWKLSLYKIPYLLGALSFFLSLTATLFLIKRLVKGNELVVMLSSGKPLWKIFLPVVFANLLIGSIFIIFVNPMSAFFLRKHDSGLEKLSYGAEKEKTIISRSGIFLYEKFKGTDRIIQAKYVDVKTGLLKGATLLIGESETPPAKRIDSEKAWVKPGKIIFIEPQITSADHFSTEPEFTIPTAIKVTDFTNNLLLPENMSVPELNDFIDKLKKTGIPSLKYELFFYKQLFKPLIMSSSLFPALCFIGLAFHRGYSEKKLALGLFGGAMLFAFMEIAFEILSHRFLPPEVSIAAVVFLVIASGNFILFHLYDS